MPLIKDKYGAKGQNIRSKFITRKKDKAIITQNDYSTKQSTHQKQEIAAQEIKNPGSTGYGTATSTTLPQGLIYGTKLNTINSVNNIFTLSKGETLKDIIISHYSGSGSSVVSLHWSIYPPQDLTFTVSTGVITAATGGTIYRLLTDTFTSSSTLSLNSNNMFDSFNNINKTIYFYAVCSVIGPEFTILKC